MCGIPFYTVDRAFRAVPDNDFDFENWIVFNRRKAYEEKNPDVNVITGLQILTNKNILVNSLKFKIKWVF